MGKSISIVKLEERLFERERAKYPNIPIYAIVKPTREDRTANGLQRCIIDFLELEGWQAERINVTGRPIFKKMNIGGREVEVLEKWITGQGTKGSADISATIEGRSVKIEVKVGNDFQRDEQKKYQIEIERAGGVYYIARNFETFTGWYNKNFIANGKK